MAERNLDFREAKSKGLVAPNKIAEQEVIKLAGGESAFKPETWWNEQLTKQINAKKFQEVSGSKLQVKSSGIMGSAGGWTDSPIGMSGFQNKPQSRGFGQEPKEGIDFRYVPTYKDVTMDVLKGITSQSKASMQEIQRLSGEKTASKKRLSRVTGGLLASASAPALGESQTTGPVLGQDTMLGVQSSLGSRRRT